MDDLIGEFLTETNESLEELDLDLVNLEQNPNDKDLLGKIFRLVHTIKGTCGFLGLPRLEKVAHHGENVLGRFRDGDLEVLPEYVTLIFECIDTIKYIVGQLGETGSEPEGDDSEIIAKLDAVYEGRSVDGTAGDADSSAEEKAEESNGTQEDKPVEQAVLAGTMTQAELDALEAAFAAAPGPADMQAPEPAAPPPPAPASKAEAPKDKPAAAAAAPAVGSQSLRVSVDVLENLMTMVSELVLTRNQLLQIQRLSTEETEFNTPLQRLNHVVSDLQEGVMKTRMQPIGNAWSKLPRIIRDLAIELNKKIELEMIGQD
ncbi:MAG: Hpt domain-containing protein, partial [Alphaproteobacteria bacterium]|nr:Hpt domain-containing protein [Alphaproteobacteria bacterium]